MSRPETKTTSKQPDTDALPTRERVHARVADPFLAARTFRRDAMRLKKMVNSDSWRRARLVEIGFVAALLRACERAVVSGSGRRRKVSRGHWLIEDAEGRVTAEVVVPARRTFEDFKLPTTIAYPAPELMDAEQVQSWASGIVNGPVRPQHRRASTEEKTP
jgi:hypothetical protein